MSEYFQFWNYKYVENYYQGIIKRLYITESDLYSLDDRILSISLSRIFLLDLNAKMPL